MFSTFLTVRVERQNSDKYQWGKIPQDRKWTHKVQGTCPTLHCCHTGCCEMRYVVSCLRTSLRPYTIFYLSVRHSDENIFATFSSQSLTSLLCKGISWLIWPIILNNYFSFFQEKKPDKIQVLLTPILRQALVAMMTHAPIRSVRTLFIWKLTAITALQIGHLIFIMPSTASGFASNNLLFLQHGQPTCTSCIYFASRKRPVKRDLSNWPLVSFYFPLHCVPWPCSFGSDKSIISNRCSSVNLYLSPKGLTKCIKFSSHKTIFQKLQILNLCL